MTATTTATPGSAEAALTGGVHDMLGLYAAFTAAGHPAAAAFARAAFLTGVTETAAARGAGVLAGRGTLLEALTVADAADADARTCVQDVAAVTPLTPETLTRLGETLGTLRDLESQRRAWLVVWALLVVATVAVVGALVVRGGPIGALAGIAAATATGAGAWLHLRALSRSARAFVAVVAAGLATHLVAVAVPPAVAARVAAGVARTLTSHDPAGSADLQVAAALWSTSGPERGSQLLDAAQRRAAARLTHVSALGAPVAAVAMLLVAAAALAGT